MTYTESTPAPLILTTRPGNFSSRSGYPVLAEYLPEAEVVVKPRKDAVRGPRRVCAAVARRFAFSRWYLSASADLEWEAFRRLRGRPRRIVHLFWADLDLGYLDYFTRPAGCVLCGTFHNCDDTLGQVIRYPKRLRRFAAIILMSESQRPFMLAAGVPAERIHVIPHGVDTHYFTPMAAKPNGFTVLSVGGYRRDFRELKRVCEILKNFPAIRVEIVGPASAAAEFSSFANVYYRFGLSDDDLLRAYKQASCFLLCVENATANNGLLEAMACGLPVVGSRVGGTSDYATPDAAMLIPSGNPERMAAAVRSLFEKPSLCSTMAAAARKRAEELDWSRVAELTRGVYSQCLEASAKNRNCGAQIKAGQYS